MSKNNNLSKNQNLCKEWNHNKNKFKPDDYTERSGKKVWWICNKCNFEWLAIICDRSYGTGCSKCAGKIVTKTNCLLTKNPELCKEWNYNRNENNPDKYMSGSNKKVWWICNRCQFEWESMINSRNRGNGCPRCRELYIDKTNCLLTKNPELCKEWNHNKNESGLNKYMPGSNKKVWWICNKCQFEWKTQINNRKFDGTGCPRCNKIYSKKCSRWIDSLNNLNIQKSKRLKTEGFIRKIEVDGIDFTTNTIYEFYGDEFHGNPQTRNLASISKITKKTYGEMYKNTVNRERLIKLAGFKLVTIWENDWDKLNK